MSSERSWVGRVALVAGLMACSPAEPGAAGEPTTGTADLTEGSLPRFAGYDATRVVNLVQYAAANTVHQVGTYDPDKVSMSAIAAELRQTDVDRRCEGERTYSKSKDDAVRLYDEFVKEMNPYESAADEDPRGTPDKHNAAVRGLMTAANTTAVFAAAYDYDTGKDPERCLRYTFVVLQSNGTATRFDFDYQD